MAEYEYRGVEYLKAKEATAKVLKHWEDNLAFANKGEYTRINTSSQACTYCNAFYGDVGRYCLGCPVMRYTGTDTCRASPYMLVGDVLDSMLCDDGKYTQTDLINVINSELIFLRKVADFYKLV